MGTLNEEEEDPESGILKNNGSIIADFEDRT